MSGKHPKMDIADRAKQFAPFAALTGHEAAIRAREKIVVDKIELSEDAAEELDRTLREIQRGMLVKAVYFKNGEYLEVTGMVARLNAIERELRIVDTVIPLEDLLFVERLSI
ncbi:MAG: YolD-like family protein [Acetatifactor sp.]|nr:YolD-like family protein [Acetatifactor sp.]